jgi:ATP-dependent Clp protease ATP-binding subunit ClpA
MDDDWLTQGMRGLVTNAVAQAARRGTTTVEAEHVLLAIAADTTNPASRALADSGLDHQVLDAALDTERRRSLAAAGAQPLDPSLLAATPRAAKASWGASIATARARAGRLRGLGRGGRSAEVGLAIGILEADLGTVPRALAFAGIDRLALLERLERARSTA